MMDSETIDLSATLAMRLLEWLYDRRYSLYMATTLSLGADDMPDWIASGKPGEKTQDVAYTMQRLTTIHATLESLPERTPQPEVGDPNFLKLYYERHALDKKIGQLRDEAIQIAMQFGLPDLVYAEWNAINDLVFEREVGKQQQ